MISTLEDVAWFDSVERKKKRGRWEKSSKCEEGGKKEGRRNSLWQAKKQE